MCKLKPTDRNIAKYFNKSVQTLTRWKTESIESIRTYNALREYYIRNEVKKGILYEQIESKELAKEKI